MNNLMLQWGPKSDFYRYATRGPNEGKWERISLDTKVESHFIFFSCHGL